MDRKYFIFVCVVAGIVLFPEQGRTGIKEDLGIKEFSYERTIERTEDMMRVQSNLHLERIQTTEIYRGADLRRKAEEVSLKAKQSFRRDNAQSRDVWRSYERQVGEGRRTTVHSRVQSGLRIPDRTTAARATAMKELQEANRRQRDTSRRIQEDHLRTIRERINSMNQRTKDMAASRR